MTIDSLAPYYSWIKALHIMSMIAWTAGMLSLPLLFAYHCDASPGSRGDAWFRQVERRLLRQIVNPAMIATWTFGTLLVLTPGIIDWDASWWRVKLAAVLLLSVLHGEMSRWRRAFDAGRNTRSPAFYRTVSATIFGLIALTVTMVVVRPF
jgi:putative membrane protein